MIHPNKTLLLLISYLCFSLSTFAQAVIEWQHCFGGALGDWGEVIRSTPDQGFVVAGYTLSNDGNVSGQHGNDDFWMAKLDSVGNLEWQKCLGGSSYDEPYALAVTADSGFVLAGFSASDDGDATGNHGSDDYWVVKVSRTGALEWQRQLGGTLVDDAFAIQQTVDGGYIVAGGAQSNDGDVTGNHGGYDCWLVKLDSAGNMLWQKAFGGTGDDIANSVQQTIDGGFILAGSTLSNNGDVSGNHGYFDYWILKLSDSATIEWQKCLGGSGEDIGYSIVQTADSGYVVTGFTKSLNGDVSGFHGAGTVPDFWTVKLSNAGILQWQKCLGGTGDDKAYCVQNTVDGGNVVTGYTLSTNGDVAGHIGNKDFWVAKLSDSGNLQWQQCLGGTGVDWARSILEIADSSYVVAGFTSSVNGDVSGNHGSEDFWVAKFRFVPTAVSAEQSDTWQLWPNPSDGRFVIGHSGTSIAAKIQIFNSFGHQVYQGSVGPEKSVLDLSRCPPGIYIAMVITEKGNWTGRVVIQ